MVEGAALEMLFRGNFNEGSNPSLSVQIIPKRKVVQCTTFLFSQTQEVSGGASRRHSLLGFERKALY